MPLRPADWVVIAAAAALVGAAAVWAWVPDTAATLIEIRSPDGHTDVRLLEDRRLRVAGFIGISEIEVADGRVRFIGAPCRNRVCLAAGWLAKSGEFAACAPNGVSVLVRGDGERYDAINY